MPDKPGGENPSRTINVLEIIQAQSQFSGPLPHPDILKGYDEVCPGAADRIIRMAESQQQHRRDIEARVVSGNVKAQARGQHYALIVLVAFAVIGGALLFMGKSTDGLVTMITPLVGVAGLFIYGRREQANERKQKLSALNNPQ